MAPKAKTLEDAFYETLKDVFFAEKQSVKALKKAARSAESDALRQVLENHAEESAGQIDRLQQVFEILGKPARSKTCEAMQGLSSEMEQDLADFADSPAADAVIAASAQAMEHYEIARYGTLKTWASQLGLGEVADLLEKTLEEEKRADALLSQVAETLNSEASEDVGNDEEGNEPAPPRRKRAK